MGYYNLISGDNSESVRLFKDAGGYVKCLADKVHQNLTTKLKATCLNGDHSVKIKFEEFLSLLMTTLVI